MPFPGFSFAPEFCPRTLTHQFWRDWDRWSNQVYNAHRSNFWRLGTYFHANSELRGCRGNTRVAMRTDLVRSRFVVILAVIAVVGGIATSVRAQDDAVVAAVTLNEDPSSFTPSNGTTTPNVLELTVPAGPINNGIIYDYIRLELDEPSFAAD
jgi:hypothetical protein